MSPEPITLQLEPAKKKLVKVSPKGLKTIFYNVRKSIYMFLGLRQENLGLRSA